VGQEHLARGREPHTPADPVEQAHAERLLQALDLPGQRRLGDVEPPRRPAEVLLLGDRHEPAELVDREIHAPEGIG
jgi:hypothetical protein